MWEASVERFLRLVAAFRWSATDWLASSDCRER
jgi:hypothetical protein